MRRPKKPSIDSIREKKFSDQIAGLRHRPHNGITNHIDSKMFPLDNNRLYHYKPEVLAGDEYKRCLQLFERRLPNEHALPTQSAVVTLQLQLQMIENVMYNKEVTHIEKLKEIAVETIRSLFDIPEHVVILPEIGKGLDVNPEDQDDSPEPALSLSDEQRREMWDEIQKRVILNGLVHGAAMHIWKSAHYIIKEKIDKLDPLLMTLYDQYTSSIGWLIWQMSPDDAQAAIDGGTAMTQGFNRLEFEEEGEPECNVLCHAVNFPVLLHEVTKGAMDYLICHGIPKTYNEEQLKYYYAKADSYENEVWHYMMSPTIWIKFVEAADASTQELPLMIAKMTQLSYQELADVLRACIDDKESGHLKLKSKNIV
ncbi:MAG: hypothetical protein AABY15_06615 [Nanoarchaeota archaeon]